MVNVPRSAVFSDSTEVFIFVAKGDKSIKVPVEVTWLDDKNGFIPFDYLPADSQIITEGSSGLTKRSGYKDYFRLSICTSQNFRLETPYSSTF